MGDFNSKSEEKISSLYRWYFPLNFKFSSCMTYFPSFYRKCNFDHSGVVESLFGRQNIVNFICRIVRKNEWIISLSSFSLTSLKLIRLEASNRVNFHLEQKLTEISSFQDDTLTLTFSMGAEISKNITIQIPWIQSMRNTCGKISQTPYPTHTTISTFQILQQPNLV